MAKFTRDILINQLGATKEEVDLILEVQEILPILGKDFTGKTSLRDLWKHLLVKKQFADWYKGQIEILELKEEEYEIVWRGTNNPSVHFKVNKENTNINSIEMVRSGYELDCIVDIGIAKGICMGIGFVPRTNKETKEISKMARQYFILMEKYCKAKVEWDEVRGKEKGRAKEVTKAFEEYVKAIGFFSQKVRTNKDCRMYQYLWEFVNLLTTGQLACELKKGEKKKITRDNVDIEINKRIDFVQEKLITLFGVRCPIETIAYQLHKEIKNNFGVSFAKELNKKISRYDNLFEE